MYADLVIQILWHTTKHISRDTHNSSYPAQSSGLSWQNGYFCLFHYTTLSEMPFFVLNRVRVLKTSATHSLYPNSPLVATSSTKNKTTLHQLVAQKELPVKEEKILKPSC